jgi:hypothetical protein
MTRMITREMLNEGMLDANQRNLNLGDRAVELNTGSVCIVLDHCPELGPESVLVELVDHDGPPLSYWLRPDELSKLA